MMKLVDKTYKAIKHKLLSELAKLDFELFRDVPSDPFGSRYIEFRSGELAIRFLFDGKECWFLIQKCVDMRQEPYQKWEDIKLERFDVRADGPERSNEIVISFNSTIDQMVSELRGA